MTQWTRHLTTSDYEIRVAIEIEMRKAVRFLNANSHAGRWNT
jgi:hypothetical protein